jgi:WD40 repeat protein/predicted Ser/Thr protein kinase
MESQQVGEQVVRLRNIQTKQGFFRKASVENQTTKLNQGNQFNLGEITMIHELKKGDTLKNGKYVIEQTIGRGGFGITYKGILHTVVKGELGEVDTTVVVAIKEFYFADGCERHPNGKTVTVTSQSKRALTERLKQKFLKEAQILSRLKHPNIVQVLEIFEENNTAYMVMQFIEGGNLKERVLRGLSMADSVRIIQEVLHALAFVHENHTLHLDIKPQNILCTKNDKAVLIDFGIAKHYDEEGEATSTAIAAKSAGFAPPEQYTAINLENFAPVTDIYAVGATLYFCLTGTVPMEATLRTQEEMPEPMALNPHIPKKLNDVVMRAMELKKNKRFQSCSEMSLALAEAWGGEATVVAPEQPKADRQKAAAEHRRPTQEASTGKAADATPKKSNKKTIITIIAVFLLAVSAIFWYTTQENTDNLASTEGTYAVSDSKNDTLLLDVNAGRQRVEISPPEPRNDSTLKLQDVNAGRQRVEISPPEPRNDNTLKLQNVNAGKCLQTMQGHTDWVKSVAFSPDGAYALSGSQDATLKLWDINTGKCLQTMQGHASYVTSVAFSPDGAYALSGSQDATLKLWDIKTGKCLQTMQGYADFVWSVAFSPDGAHALSGSGDNTLKLWDIKTGKCLQTMQGHASYSYVASVAFSPNGAYALSGSGDKTLKLWDIKTGKCLQTMQGHANEVFSVAFSPNGAYALSGSYDNTLKLWDINTGKCLQTMEGHSGWVWSVAFSPDGAYALSGSDDKTLKLWDINTGKCLQTMQGHASYVTSVAFSPDGAYALSGSFDKTLKLWDLRKWARR